MKTYSGEEIYKAACQAGLGDRLSSIIACRPDDFNGVAFLMWMHGKEEHIPAMAEALGFDDWSQLFPRLLEKVYQDGRWTGRIFEREDARDGVSNAPRQAELPLCAQPTDVPWEL